MSDLAAPLAGWSNTVAVMGSRDSAPSGTFHHLKVAT